MTRADKMAVIGFAIFGALIFGSLVRVACVGIVGIHSTIKGGKL